ncbi:MAG: hypothetical protein ABR544_02870 [Gammaproteobacteria bacterium]
MSKLEDKLSASVKAGRDRSEPVSHGKQAAKGKSGSTAGKPSGSRKPAGASKTSRGDGDLNSAAPALHPARIWPD